MATLYPMLVMTMDTFLGLDTLVSHQNMLKDKRLLPYNPETMDKRVIFVSHQWTSFGEADHTGIQIQTLQRVLRRLMAGSISKVATNWQQRVTLGTNEVVTAAQCSPACMPPTRSTIFWAQAAIARLLCTRPWTLSAARAAA